MPHSLGYDSLKHWCIAALVCVCLSAIPALAQNTPAAERELEQVQQKIKQTEQSLRQQRRQLQQAEQKLQQADQALAQASLKLRQTTTRKQQLEQESTRLSLQQQKLQQELTAQQKLLAAQLKSAYSMGQHDYSRLLLNQQDTAKLERLLTYYQYFNQARMRQLAKINKTVQDLAKIADKLIEQQALIQVELTNLEQQQQQLTVARASQQDSIKQLQAVLAEQGNQLSYLRQNESSLQNTINELRRLADQNKDMAGLIAGKGKYPWPVKGQLLQRFGQNRQGGMPARGILIKGINGANVQAIAEGRVIYADWLKGYGWVIVLDHGAGFMSLYGHNQTLLKQPGDRINAGEAIALVGASGGQVDPALYFEIRDKGEAINPLLWLTRP